MTPLRVLHSGALLLRQDVTLKAIVSTKIHLLEIPKCCSSLKRFLLFSAEFLLTLKGWLFSSLFQTGTPQRIHHHAIVLLEVVNQCIPVLNISLRAVFAPGIYRAIIFPKLVAVECIERLTITALYAYRSWPLALPSVFRRTPSLCDRSPPLTDGCNTAVPVPRKARIQLQWCPANLHA